MMKLKTIFHFRSIFLLESYVKFEFYQVNVVLLCSHYCKIPVVVNFNCHRFSNSLRINVNSQGHILSVCICCRCITIYLSTMIFLYQLRKEGWNKMKNLRRTVHYWVNRWHYFLVSLPFLSAYSLVESHSVDQIFLFICYL